MGIGGLSDPEEDDDGDSYSDLSEVDVEAHIPPPPRHAQEPAAKAARVDETKWKAALLKNPEEKIALRDTCVICMTLPPRVCFKNCGN